MTKRILMLFSMARTIFVPILIVYALRLLLHDLSGVDFLKKGLWPLNPDIVVYPLWKKWELQAGHDLQIFNGDRRPDILTNHRFIFSANYCV